MKNRILLPVALSMLISACGESNDEAVGLYKYKHLSGTEKVLEVVKDGDTYLFIEDKIRNTQPVALLETEDGLFYSNIPIKLSKDGKTLFFSYINAKRVTEQEFTNYIEIQQRNELKCTLLQSELDENNKVMEKGDWNDYVKDVRTRIPENCRLTGLYLRSESSLRW